VDKKLGNPFTQNIQKIVVDILVNLPHKVQLYS